MLGRIVFFLFGFGFAVNVLAITNVGENCAPDTSYGGTGVVTTTSSGTLRSGTSLPGGLVETSVTLNQVDSYYTCKNTELKGVKIPDCGKNNENLKGAVVEQNCIARLNGTNLCVQSLFKWVDAPRKEETIVNLDVDNKSDGLFCAHYDETCDSQWGNYCLKGQYVERCNLPLNKCTVLSEDDENCVDAGWTCVRTDPNKNNICLDVKFKYNCKKGEDTCKRWVSRDTCTGLEIPDFNYEQKDEDGSEGFAEVVKTAQAVEAVKNEMQIDSTGKIRIFKGESIGCMKQYFPMYCNCCGKDAEKAWKKNYGLVEMVEQLLCSCTKNEAKRWISDKKGLVTDVVTNRYAMQEPDRLLYGDKYSRWGNATLFSAFGCPEYLLDKRRNYSCKWNSKIARIIQEQGRIQLRELSNAPALEFESNSVSVSLFSGTQGNWKQLISDLWGRKYWIWQFPEKCATGHGSPLECPVGNDLYIITCDPSKGCSSTWSPTVSPMLKRKYKDEGAYLVTLPVNDGFYHVVDSLTYANADCSDESCLIDYKAWSRITPISSVGWVYEYMFYDAKWNSGINVGDVWIEPYSYGDNDKASRWDNKQVKIRFSTNTTPNSENPDDYTELTLLIEPNGDLKAEDNTYNGRYGISLPNDVWVFGKCNVKQDKCQIFAWKPKSSFRKPFYLGGHYDKIKWGPIKYTNYCKYTDVSLDCSGYSLDEFALLDIDKIDFDDLLGDLYTPITPGLRTTMKNKVTTTASSSSSSLGGTVEYDANGKPKSYSPPSNTVVGGSGVGLNGAGIVISKAFCEKAPCEVAATFLRYLQDQYVGNKHSPTNGSCYPLSIQVDWGDGTVETVNNPAGAFIDPNQCSGSQKVEPFPSKSHTFYSPGVFKIVAKYYDSQGTGKTYKAEALLQVSSEMYPDSYTNKGRKEGPLMEE